MPDVSHKPVVLHIAADYKCAHNPNGTSSIPELVDCTREFANHIVISIRRTANPFKVELRRGTDVHWQYTYFGLPFGIGIGSSLALAARSIARYAGEDLRRADIVHAHKLSCEALIATRLLGQGQKLAVSIRGSSDVKVARFHPLARRMMRRALLRAQSVLWVSAWARPAFEKMGLRCAARACQTLFPNTVETIPAAQQAFDASHASHATRLCAIFRLDHYRLKGLPNLLLALSAARKSGHDLRLDIAGGGTPANLARINRLIAGHGLADVVHLLGALPRSDVRARLASYDAMVLPSRNETFGLAYLEALSAGVPVLYSLGTGVDGYLPSGSGAVGVHANSVDSITDGLLRIASDHSAMRAQAAAYWQGIGERQFSRAKVCERYAEFVLRPSQQ